MLAFSDETDRYYNAICDGVQTETIYSDGMTGSISFTVPDGMAHGKLLKEFKLKPLYKEGTTTIVGYKFDVENNGNVAVPVNFKIPIPAGEENGYLGLAATTGAMEFGDIEETDKVPATKAVTLFKYATADEIKSAMTVGSGVLTEAFAHSGKFATATYPDKETYLVNGSDWGSSNSTKWYGACGRIPIPEDTKYPSQALTRWVLGFRLAFATHLRKRQTGMIQIVVAYKDSSGAEKLLCDMHIIKDNFANNRARMKFKITGANAKNGDVKEVDYEPRSDRGITRPGNGKEIWIQKYYSKFTICFAGKQYSFSVPSAKNLIPSSVTIAFLDRKDSQESLYYLGVKSIYFQKICSYIADIPNRYQPKDVLEINGQKGKFYVNGNPQMADEVLGTTYITAEPNTTTEVEVTASTFCPMSKVYKENKAIAWIEEAWI